MVTQLVHCCILAKTLNCIFLNDLANRFGQQEACWFKSLLRVLVVQLKDLIERFFSDFVHALTIPPLRKGISLCVSLLYALHIIKNDERCTKELILGRSVQIDWCEVFFHFFTLLNDLFQLVVVAFQTFDILIEALLSLIDGLLLVLNKFAPLSLELDGRLPSLEVLGLLDSVSLRHCAFCEFAERTHSWF